MFTKQKKLLMGVAAVSAMAVATGAAEAKDTIKIAVPSFLSGGAAGPFGVPARNGAELVINAINAGKLPAPYSKKGFAGAKAEPIFIDESGGSTKQVAEYRNLVQKRGVDAVIGGDLGLVVNGHSAEGVGAAHVSEHVPHSGGLHLLLHLAHFLGGAHETAHGTHLSHHLAGAVEALVHLAHIFNRPATTPCNSAHSGFVEHIGIAAFLVGHGEDDRLDPAQLALVEGLGRNL